MDLADLCKDKKVQLLMLRECNAAGKKSGFASIETLQAVVLISEEWTPQSGLVTPAQKLQRRKIEERYGEEIKVSSCNAIVALISMSPVKMLTLHCRKHSRVHSDKIKITKLGNIVVMVVVL